MELIFFFLLQRKSLWSICNLRITLERRLLINNDPFSPPLNENLVVTHDLNSKHRIVYNKYGLIKYHILLITKEFETQDTPLDYYDIEAMLIAKSAVKNGIVFFNCGANGGASQPHKHMQCFSEDNFDIINEFNNNCKTRILITEVFSRFFDRKRDNLDELQSLHCPLFPFKHEIRYFKQPISTMLANDKIPKSEVISLVFDVYKQMLKNCDYTKFFNFILTDEYMFIVPRSTGNFNGYHINSITFMGIQYFREKSPVQGFKDIGPFNALCNVTIKE